MSDESLFLLAQEKATPAERTAFLDEACAGDAERRRRIERLLGADALPVGILERGPELDDVDVPFAGSSLKPERLFAGRYKLRQKLGEGGMGEVWVADQIEPVQRRVALKVVRLGHDTSKMLARFEQERQALAVMDHPNIAKVLDAGVDEDGRPYFVMELIKGVAITEYCDAEKLSPRQRIELFLPVCHAVQHAHQKGLIHRDLKPSNILVGLYDDRAVPKVIDFGVAKATGLRLSEQSIYTEIGSLIGTLEYMSPEQAEPNNIDIDTRSDIYSLGAVLYELLTGSVPFSRKDLQAAAFVEMLRIIKEVEPPKPSTKLSGSGTLPSVAAVRRTEPHKLVALMRGDLDWIVVKCLEKSRGRRYATANALAMDLQRYLADETVAAGPPSAGYRVRKFLRRNRALVAAAAIMLVLLLGGMVGTSIGMVRARQARHDEAERAEGERRAKLSAEKRLAQIENGIEILSSVFENIDPNAEEKEGRPFRQILADRLDKAAAELEGEAVGDVLMVARLQDRLARTYMGLGYFEKALALFAKAVATRRAELGDDDPLTLRSMSGLASAHFQSGRTKEALKLFEELRDAQTRVFGPTNRETLTTQTQIGWIFWLTDEPNKGIELLERVRDELVAQVGEDHEETIETYRALAAVYTSAKKPTQAIATAHKMLAGRRKHHADDHPLVINAMNTLGFILKNNYKMTDARKVLENARDIAVPKLGPTHPITLAILYNLADCYRAFNRLDEAIDLGEQVHARRILVLGADHWSTVSAGYALALSYRRDKQFEKALPLLIKDAEETEKLNYAKVAATDSIMALCDTLENLKRFDQAEVWRRKLIRFLKTKDGPESPDYIRQRRDLCENLLHQHKFEDAEPLLREALALLKKHKPKSWQRSHTESLLGAALLGQKQFDDAKPLLVEGYRGLQAAAQDAGAHHFDAPSSEQIREARERIVQLYEAWGKEEEADKWRNEK